MGALFHRLGPRALCKSSSAVAPPVAALGLSWFPMRNQIDVQPAGPCTKRRRSAAQHQAAGGAGGSRTGCASVLVRVVLIKLFPESGSKFLC